MFLYKAPPSLCITHTHLLSATGCAGAEGKCCKWQLPLSKKRKIVPLPFFSCYPPVPILSSLACILPGDFHSFLASGACLLLLCVCLCSLLSFEFPLRRPLSTVHFDKTTRPPYTCCMVCLCASVCVDMDCICLFLSKFEGDLKEEISLQLPLDSLSGGQVSERLAGRTSQKTKLEGH